MRPILKSSLVILTIILFQSCKKDKPVPPTITTKAITEISTTTALSGGDITNQGGAPLLFKGVCWNTTTDPTIDHNKNSETTGSASFTCNISQLAPNTTYYVRAFATNSAGTGYGESVSFKTLGDKPSSNILNATNIQVNSATLNGSVNPNSLSTTVTFEYGPTTGYGSTTVLQSPVTGSTDKNVTSDITGLVPGKTYHFRIKAENSLGITYTGDMTFITLGQIPAATTLTTTNLQVRTVTINGSVNPNYLSSIVIFEWGLTSSYGNTITANQSPVNGNTSVNVNSDLTGLTPGTTYHFRINATNELGTSSGNDLTFTTLGQIPTAITQATTNLHINTATLNGSVNPNYLPTTVIFEWGTSASYGNSITIPQSPITGNTSQNITADLLGLSEQTAYHFRIKATNELGTTTGNDLTFITYALVDADNNYYYSETIGTQTWMKENLKTTRYVNGDLIGTTTPPTLDVTSESAPKYQWPSNSIIDNVSAYGRIYTWFTVSDSRKICPTGWHVPSNTEWTTLVNFIGGASNAASKLKESGTLHWESPNADATDDYRFTALPAGYRTGYGLFTGFKSSAYFWSLTEANATDALFWPMWSEIPYFNNGNLNKSYGFSIRCIKD